MVIRFAAAGPALRRGGGALAPGGPHGDPMLGKILGRHQNLDIPGAPGLSVR